MNRYVFFANSADHMIAAYKDLFSVDNVKYKAHYLEHSTRFLDFLNHVHCRSKTTNQFHLPLKKIWYNQYFSEKYIEGTRYIFVFFTNWHLIFENGYLSFLRKHYPGCKCVLFLQDIHNARKLNMDQMKKLFDHIMIFEKNFAKEHGIAYHPLVYSSYDIANLSTERPIDLLFVGKDKGRYKFLRETYDRLSEQGINCQFYISDTDESRDVPRGEGIHLMDFVPYKKNIELLRKAKCVLDIVPPNTNCNTLRMYEAIAYEVKVLTNNKYITTESYYNPEFVSLYTSCQDMNASFLKNPYTGVDYGCKDRISPLELLKYLDRILGV